MEKNLKTFIKKILLILKKPEMGILPGHLAYFFVLSLIPLITLLVFFGSFISISSEELLSFFNKSLPSVISNFLVPAFTESPINTGTVILVITTFIVASNGAYSVIKTSNTLYKIQDSSKLRNRIKSIQVTILLLSLILFMFVIPIFGRHIIDLLGNLIKSKEIYESLLVIYNISQIPLSLIYIYFNIKVIYTISPDMKIKSKEVTTGALFTTITWVIAVQIYSYYLANFSDYTRVYGNLSTIIILMFFIYILSYLFVVGMALNASKHELEEQIEKTGKIKSAKKQII